jgi:hypothetical protein
MQRSQLCVSEDGRMPSSETSTNFSLAPEDSVQVTDVNISNPTYIYFDRYGLLLVVIP